jgi:hypothetical protein
LQSLTLRLSWLVDAAEYCRFDRSGKGCLCMPGCAHLLTVQVKEWAQRFANSIPAVWSVNRVEETGPFWYNSTLCFFYP